MTSTAQAQHVLYFSELNLQKPFFHFFFLFQVESEKLSFHRVECTFSLDETSNFAFHDAGVPRMVSKCTKMYNALADAVSC